MVMVRPDPTQELFYMAQCGFTGAGKMEGLLPPESSNQQFDGQSIEIPTKTITHQYKSSKMVGNNLYGLIMIDHQKTLINPYINHLFRGGPRGSKSPSFAGRQVPPLPSNERNMARDFPVGLPRTRLEIPENSHTRF